MTQGKKTESKTEVLKKQSSDILDLEKTIQKDIQVDDLSLKNMVDESVNSACTDLFTSKRKPVKKEKTHTEAQKQEPADKSSFALTLSNHLKIAENKIKELEYDNESLRLDNEKLVVAGEALQTAVDKFSNENKMLKSNHKEERVSWEDQKSDLENTLEDQSVEIKSLKMKINALEKHLSRDVKKIRVKERELENRLELKQNEMESVIHEKDQTLLKFKQELDFLREKVEKDRKSHHQWMEQRVQDRDRVCSAIQSLQKSLKLLENSAQQEEDFSLEEKSLLFEKSSEIIGPEASQEVLSQAEPPEPAVDDESAHPEDSKAKESAG